MFLLSTATPPHAERTEPSLTCSSDCNDSPPLTRFAVLAVPNGTAALLSGHAGLKHGHHFSASCCRQWEKGQIDAGVKRWIGNKYRSPIIQPPVTLMWRLTLGRLWRRSMMKSCPLGFCPMARSIAAPSSALSGELRSGLRRSEASSCPRQVWIVPVQVMRTRLQDSQKLCVIGVMKPSLPPVSATRT